VGQLATLTQGPPGDKNVRLKGLTGRRLTMKGERLMKKIISLIIVTMALFGRDIS
jgi:hypothetical protein